MVGGKSLQSRRNQADPWRMPHDAILAKLF